VGLVVGVAGEIRQVVSFLTSGVGWGGGLGILYNGSLLIGVTLPSKYKLIISRGSSLVPSPWTRYLSSEGMGVWMTRGGNGLDHLAFMGLV